MKTPDLDQKIEKLTPNQRAEFDRCLVGIEAIDLAGSFREFISAAWPVLEPGNTFVEAYYIDAIAEYLEAVTLGQINRLIINIPPRHGKSIIASVMWPCWCWARNPGDRFMCASYSGQLSVKHSVDRNALISSPWYRSRWGHKVVICDNDDSKQRFSNTARGHMIATSMTGSATGLGGNKLIVDDPVNPEQANSEVERENANRQFDQTLTTRLDRPATDAIVIIMQRLHEEDVTGHVLAKKSTNELINLKSWVHLKLRSEGVAGDKVYFIGSKRTIERQEGDLLNETRFPRDVIEQAKVDMGPVGFAGQHQQEPSAMEGNIIKRAWIRWWSWTGGLKEWNGKVEETTKLPDFFDEEIQSWDMTFKDTDGSDFVAGHVYGRLDAMKFLIAREHAHMDFPATIKAVERMTGRFPNAQAKYVEDKANGPAVIAWLQNSIAGMIAVEPTGSKTARLYAASTDFAAGNVFLPHPSVFPWGFDVAHQLCTIPNAAHDDDGDACSQAINKFRGMVTGLSEWLKKERQKKIETEANAAQLESLMRDGKANGNAGPPPKSIMRGGRA